METSTKSQITIQCLDNSTRVITCNGRYSQEMAKSLASDLEPRNIKGITITIL